MIIRRIYVNMRHLVNIADLELISTAIILIINCNPLIIGLRVVEACNNDMEGNQELVKALAAENKDVPILKDLVSASPDSVQIDVLCSSEVLSVLRVTHLDTSFLIKQFHSCTADVRRRLQIEYKALKLRTEQLPGSVPLPYLLSDQHNCVVLEDFKYKSLRLMLTTGELDEDALNRLIDVVSTLHKSSFSPEKLKQLENDFKHNAVTEALLKSRYEDTFEESRLTGELFAGSAGERARGVRVRVAALYKGIAEQRETLIHGHLNDYNVETYNGSVKLIGNHLAILGPTSLDVGTLLAQYLATYHVHMLTEENNDAHRQVSYKMIHAATHLVETYLNNMGELFNEEKRKSFVSSVAGHCGVELINWATHSPNHPASQAVLDSGLRLVDASHRIHTGAMLANIALMLTF